MLQAEPAADVVPLNNQNEPDDAAVPQAKPAPDADPEKALAIDAVPENEPEDDAVLQSEPAADVMPLNNPDAAEEAAVIDNDHFVPVKDHCDGNTGVSVNDERRASS